MMIVFFIFQIIVVCRFICDNLKFIYLLFDQYRHVYYVCIVELITSEYIVEGHGRRVLLHYTHTVLSNVLNSVFSLSSEWPV